MESFNSTEQYPQTIISLPYYKGLFFAVLRNGIRTLSIQTKENIMVGQVVAFKYRSPKYPEQLLARIKQIQRVDSRGFLVTFEDMNKNQREELLGIRYSEESVKNLDQDIVCTHPFQDQENAKKLTETDSSNPYMATFYDDREIKESQESLLSKFRSLFG